MNEVSILESTLRRRVLESGKKSNYYLSQEEYTLGEKFGLFKEISRKPQGSGINAVTVSFEGNSYVVSVYSCY